jgi:ribosomal protein S12 methylthiotransferase accessory factor
MASTLTADPPGIQPDQIAGATKFFEAALAASRLCGVTRLADITGLDRLGLPVWQAVRPAGRALSVHQGKGASPLAAKIGALCEAMESHCAENASADGPSCEFAQVPPRMRAPDVGDYCRDRRIVPKPSARIDWCTAFDLLSGDLVYLPHPLVSLDFTRGLPSPFERTSDGLGAGSTEAAAIQTALLEAVERDALGEWIRLAPEAKEATAVTLDSIRLTWFQSWRARLLELGVQLRVFHVDSLIGMPVIRCVIGGVEEFGQLYRRFFGASAHGDPATALFKALAEAIQSRLTLIAGVRDDILPSYYVGRTPSGDQSPATSAHDPRQWHEIEPADHRPESIAARLAAAGYTQVAVKRLDDGIPGVAVAKVFVPGLGTMKRSRRRVA